MKTLAALFVWLAIPTLAQDRFYPFTIDQDKLAGAADFSHLNRALTPADRVFIRNGHFYTVGSDLKPNTADDRRIRFFGANLAFGANFPEPQDAHRIAKRLRKLGVNLVRLHHMDTSPDKDPATARSILTDGPFPSLNPISVARLRSFLDALKAEGIYANLNLHVGYEFRPAVDGVPAVPGSPRLPTQSKPLHLFYPAMIDKQCDFTRKVLDALKLNGDVVLAMVEISNETSLIDSWQKNSLEKLVTGPYREELDRQKTRFLAGRPDTPDLTIEFLIDRDRHYLNRMKAAVREKVGPLVPVAGTQIGFGGLMNFDSHRDLDYQDNHFYIDHYNFPNQRWDGRDWRIRDTSSSGTGFDRYLNMAATREHGRPFTVSEFNQPFPNRQAAEIDPTLAAFAAFQDWDSIMHFAYEHGREWDRGAPSGFNINGDWTKFPNIGQSAWLYRTGAVQAARKHIAVTMPYEQRLASTRGKFNGAVTKFLQTSGGFDANVAFLHAIAMDSNAKNFSLPAEAKQVAAPFRSDTGEILYDPERKIFTLAAPQAAGVYGFAGKQKAAAGAIEVELAPQSRGFVALTLTALDGKAIPASGRLLLTIPGCTLRTYPGSDPERPQKFIPYPGASGWFTLEPDPTHPNKPSGAYGGGPSKVWMERVECHVTLRTQGKSVAVYPLDGAGARMRALPARDVAKTAGGVRIHLQADGQDFAPWYEIVVK